MLDVNRARFAFPAMAFDFSLRVERGSFTAIIGPSGGGKSTLLHLIAGFEMPTSGSIHLADKDIASLHPSQRSLSIIFQDNNLFPHLTVSENVGLGVSASLRLGAQQSELVTRALEQVGLDHFANRKPGELSGGERQRVAIARALLRNKPLLLLDEAFAALGPALRHDMLALVKRLHAEKGLTTLMVTHQPEDARAVASHAAFVSGGAVKFHAPIASFFADRTQTELHAYLGETAQTV